ncbi:hypothetical protein FO519_001649 [Halicephalobus sp. NKZ332]|nr:hypothetical protein FO519_001649 [Halicephalobus sp. NKZ332]
MSLTKSVLNETIYLLPRVTDVVNKVDKLGVTTLTEHALVNTNMLITELLTWLDFLTANLPIIIISTILVVFLLVLSALMIGCSLVGMTYIKAMELKMKQNEGKYPTQGSKYQIS